MKNKRKEKKPSKFKEWRQKMKATPKGRAYLKLIYWAIFFMALFLFLGITSMLTRNYDPSEIPLEEEKREEESEVVLPTLNEMMQALVNGTYEYTYDIHVGENSFLFEGTKYLDHEEGYKSYNTTSGNGIIRYYLDEAGTYQLNGDDFVLISNFYEGINANYLDLEYIFTEMQRIGLEQDLNNASYPVYTGSDEVNYYLLNVSPEKNQITDISIVSLDGNDTYLLSFSHVGDVLDE